MLFSELPVEVQERLNGERKAKAGRFTNDAYEIHLYNEDGTRYFRASRVCKPWVGVKDNHALSMPFGGGTYWSIAYGAVQFRSFRNPFGQIDYELCDGKRYGKSANGTEIPSTLPTKKDVLALVKTIGIFNL